MALLNDVKFTATTTGTADFGIGSAASGFLTPSGAGAVNGTIYSYSARSGAQFESGQGAYSSGGATIARTTILESSAGTGTKENFSIAPTVILTALKQDFATLNSGLIVTTNQPLLDLSQTWNAGAVVFTGLKLNITNMASAAGSLLFDFQVGGNSICNLQNSTGVLTIGDNSRNLNAGVLFTTNGGFTVSMTVSNGNGLIVAAAPQAYFSGALSLVNSLGIGTSTFGTDVFLARDAAQILAQRNSTNAQTFRVYNTFTDASNYERAVFDWTTTANTLTIGTQAGGTGSVRTLQFVVGGSVKLDYGVTNANVLYSTGDSAFGTGAFKVDSGNANINGYSGCVYGWTSGSAISGSLDTGVSRSAAGVVAFGNGGKGDGSATILAKTKAGAPSISDVPAGTWALIRDTSGATTKLYYNNAGTLMTVALT